MLSGKSRLPRPIVLQCELLRRASPACRTLHLPVVSISLLPGSASVSNLIGHDWLRCARAGASPSATLEVVDYLLRRSRRSITSQEILSEVCLVAPAA